MTIIQFPIINKNNACYLSNDQDKWILRLLENSNENWKIIPQKYFENIGENFLIFNMNLDSFKSLKMN